MEVSLARRELIRHAFTTTALMSITTERQEVRAKSILCQFISETARVEARTRKVVSYCKRVENLQQKMRRLVDAHRAQTTVLGDLFDKVKGNILHELFSMKQKNKDAFAMEVREALDNLDMQAKVEALAAYMHRARRVYDEVVDQKRRKLEQGVSLHSEDILLGGGFLAAKPKPGPEKQSGATKKPAKDLLRPPVAGAEDDLEEYFKIYSFDQLSRSDAAGEPGYLASLCVPPKTRKKLSAFHDKLYPKHKA